MITVEYLDHAGDDLGVVNAARVSHGECSEEFDDVADAGLIRFLARGMSTKDFNNLYANICNTPRREYVVEYLRQWRSTPVHKSPFNHVWCKFRIDIPVFVARQLVKHEYLPWNERSGRYEKADWSPSFYMPADDDWRGEAANVKQGSGAPLDAWTVAELKHEYELLMARCQLFYEYARDKGLCAEQARMALPQSMMTTVVWSGTLHAFANMCKLRLDPTAQAESRAVAHGIHYFLKKLFPVSTEALLDYGVR